MDESDIPLPASTTTDQIKKSVQGACEALGLTISMETSLSSYPGSVHWHIKKGKEKGTLELTTWPGRRLLWAKIQAGRRAEWIDSTLHELSRKIQDNINIEAL